MCPDLILVPPQYDQYLKYSKLAHDIYYRYSDLVEPFGMDECWIGLPWLPHEEGLRIAEEIRATTKRELGLSVSIGVSFSKIYAKLGSDMKKPDAITSIRREDYKEKVWPLPASDLLYVGRATEAKLLKYGIHTIGELAATNPETLRYWFGVNGLKLWSYANGIDESRVMPMDFVSPVKSIGHGITCNADLLDNEEVKKVILELSQDVGHRLRVHGLAAAGVQISVRRNDLYGEQYQCKLPIKTQLPCEIAAAAFNLFQARFHWTTHVRAVCVRAIDLPEAIFGELESAFVLLADGDGMKNAGILSGDQIIFERSIKPSSGDIVVGRFNGALLCRRIFFEGEAIRVRREDGETPDVITSDYMIFGIMVGLARNCRKAG